MRAAAAAQCSKDQPFDVPEGGGAPQRTQLLLQNARQTRAQQEAPDEEDVLIKVARDESGLTCGQRHSSADAVADAVAGQGDHRNCGPEALCSGAVAVKRDGVEGGLRTVKQNAGCEYAGC